ncbi:MAG: endolytic transglycosylase MltG [Proteobacteria bacterium]|jgi:UPF0755 protein|nr:endolytic transglycosylase MltG [Pseudomonadota bacterium]
MVPRARRLSLFITIIFTIFFWAATIRILFLLYSPYPPYPAGTKILIEVPAGTGLKGTAKILARHSLIPSVPAFVLFGYARGASAEIKAGTYEFSLPVAPAQLLRDLASGRVKVYRVTIPEGYNLFQIAEAMAAAGITGSEGFLRTARDPGLLADLKIPGDSAEGYLYPNTYYFAHGVNPEQVVRKMADSFWEVFNPLWEEIEPGVKSSLAPEKTVILASVIEKETADPAERPLIAAAFLNRLRRGMRLDSDPTVIYGIWDKFEGNLRRADLTNPTPYNTYRIHGLPPGPICNPGRDALRAVLHPAPVPYLYFVSRNDGTHQFSSALTEHNRWVSRYQKSKLRNKKLKAQNLPRPRTDSRDENPRGANVK